MGGTTKELFGKQQPQPATPESYGKPPRGYRLPDETRLGPVHLRITELARSVGFYESVLGMRVLDRGDGSASLSAHGDDRVLLRLQEQRGAAPAPRQGRLGLYHFALLLPDRAALGRFVGHLAAQGIQPGASDHLVSEALYLRDPDDLGIEVYVDRPRETWRRVDRELMMATDPLDLNGLLGAAEGRPWKGMPAGAVIGHVHLHVGDIDRAGAFFSDALGFDRMVWSYPGALFLGAGGYHHHLGTNTWAGTGARPTREDEAGLLEWTIELPDAHSIEGAVASLSAAGYSTTRSSADVVTTDPWGTAVRLRVR